MLSELSYLIFLPFCGTSIALPGISLLYGTNNLFHFLFTKWLFLLLGLRVFFLARFFLFSAANAVLEPLPAFSHLFIAFLLSRFYPSRSILKMFLTFLLRWLDIFIMLFLYKVSRKLSALYYPRIARRGRLLHQFDDNVIWFGLWPFTFHVHAFLKLWCKTSKLT